ncbi:conserved hypothetical protein [[Clostridium] ultunense Esp]|nr:YqzM family protein [Thermicanus aegyptius]CCQ94352.1 conserved hypothetical protein [[Clostridium] ultunense Esp]
MTEEMKSRIENENDLTDAITGFLVGFGFFLGIGILAMILQFFLVK